MTRVAQANEECVTCALASTIWPTAAWQSHTVNLPLCPVHLLLLLLPAAAH
jgi:hypothetical protein